MLLSFQKHEVENPKKKHYQSHDLLMILDKDKQAGQTDQSSDTVQP